MSTFTKVVEKDKDGKDVEVLKMGGDVAYVPSRTTSLDEQLSVLDALKRHKLREIKRWDDKIAVQKEKVKAAATALGSPVNTEVLDSEPSDVEEEGPSEIRSGGQVVPQK